MTVADSIYSAIRLVGEESTYGYDSSEWIVWLNDAQNFLVFTLDPFYLQPYMYEVDLYPAVAFGSTGKILFSNITSGGHAMMQIVSARKVSNGAYYEEVPKASATDYFMGTHRADVNHP